MFRSVIRSPAIAACGALGAVAAGSARATNWLVTMGGGVNLAPPYEGAGNDDPRPSLTFNLRRANVSYRFTPPDGGNTIALISTHHFVFGPVVRFSVFAGRHRRSKRSRQDRVRC